MYKIDDLNSCKILQIHVLQNNTVQVDNALRCMFGMFGIPAYIQ